MELGFSFRLTHETRFELRQTFIPIRTAVCPKCGQETMLLPVRTLWIVDGKATVVSLYVCNRGHGTFEPKWRLTRARKIRVAEPTPSCTPGCGLPFDFS